MMSQFRRSQRYLGVPPGARSALTAHFCPIFRAAIPTRNREWATNSSPLVVGGEGLCGRLPVSSVSVSSVSVSMSVSVTLPSVMTVRLACYRQMTSGLFWARPGRLYGYPRHPRTALCLPSPPPRPSPSPPPSPSPLPLSTSTIAIAFANVAAAVTATAAVMGRVCSPSVSQTSRRSPYSVVTLASTDRPSSPHHLIPTVVVTAADRTGEVGKRERWGCRASHAVVDWNG